MNINLIAHYLPKTILTNEYFAKFNGFSSDDIYKRTGILQRRKASEKENTNTMAVEAVNALIQKNPDSIKDVDLIIGCTYSPYDTIGTLAHQVQGTFNITGARVISLSTACSSMLNAIEIVEALFATKKSQKALVITSEQNSAYSDERNQVSGFIWGDGAAAMIISNQKNINETNFKIIDIITVGLADIGKGPDAVCCKPGNGGLVMPDGKNVFCNAVVYMTRLTNEILAQNNYHISDLNYLIPHQANMRIINNVAQRLNLSKEQTITNIDRLGNTGCASTAIALSENLKYFKMHDLIVVTVFGGGFSCGTMLLKTQ